MRGRFNGRVIGQDYTGRNTRHNGRAGVYNAVQSAFAPSLDITLANGLGPLFTFTRATTATVKDFESLIKGCLSGELRIQGARRVRNMLSSSYDLGVGANWSTGASGVTTTGGIADPNGGTTAYRITAGAGATKQWYKALSAVAGDLSRLSLWIRRATGNGAVKWLNAAGNAGNSVPLTSSWQRLADAQLTCSGGIIWPGLDFATTGDEVDVWHPLLEIQNGQSNANPSEYVSVGELSSPYHGYFVDGVKYFSYENGNTVASNVVTEAQGAAITGTIGYLAEGARTNLAIQSEDLATGWTLDDVTISANAIAAPNGTVTADKIQEDTDNSDHYVWRASTVAAGTATLSVYLKAAERSIAYIYMVNSSTAIAWFDLSSGTVGTVSGSGSPSATIEELPDGWYRATLTATVTLNANFGFGPTTADNTTSYAGTLNSGIYAWGAQIEAASFASTYIPTTTASVARNADVLTCPSAGILLGTQGTVYAKVKSNWTTAPQNPALILGESAGQSELLSCESVSTAVFAYDAGGGATAAKTGISDMNAGLVKVASSWGAGGLKVTGNGLAPATAAFGGDMGIPSTAGIGCNITGTANWHGVIAELRIYRTQLSDAQLQALTS